MRVQSSKTRNISDSFRIPYPKATRPRRHATDRFEVADSAERLNALQPKWDASIPDHEWLAPIVCPQWAQAYAESYGPGAELIIAVGQRNGASGIAALHRPKARPHRLEFLGQRDLWEPMDFAYTEPSALEVVAAGIARLGYPLRLYRMPVESPATAALLQALKGRAIVIQKPSWGCPWIALDESWKCPEGHLNAGRRSDLRRARRRAEALGPLNIEILAPSPVELRPMLDEAFEVEGAGWKRQEGSALLSNEAQAEFYRKYAHAAATTGILRVCFLRIAGKAAATQLALEAHGRFWLLKIGYSNEFGRCSPGILLMAETIRHAAQRGLRAYEFLGNSEEWIRVWTPQERPCVSVRAYPFTIRGVAGLSLDMLAAVRRRLKSRA